MHKQIDWLFWSAVIFLSLFIILGLLDVDYGLLYYVFLFLMIIAAIFVRYMHLHNSRIVYVGLMVLGLIHVFGSIVYVSGNTLYTTWIIRDVFKWDNLVHTVGSIVATLIAYGVMHPYVKNIKNKVVLSLLMLFVGLGIGAGIEILELFFLIFFNTVEVGNYLNNAWDLVFDTIGAAIACTIIISMKK